MKEDAIVGVTSNPTIFQKALATGEWYDEQLGEVLKTEDDPTEIFLQLAMEDIRRACDLMRPIWDGSQGEDGYVSLEVDPTLAYDREATFEQAIRCTRRSTGRTSSSINDRAPASPRSRTASRRASRST